MKIAAIICEYNPFHSGHAYHIAKTRERTGADYIIALMSGNYVQRGTPAIMDKSLRTSMALSNGIDAVIELPLWFACGSASYFAKGAITLLDHLGIVDYLSFGCEWDQEDTLSHLAAFLHDHDEEIAQATAAYLRIGHSYPRSRELALKDMDVSSEWVECLREPNNILAIEYLKALKERSSSIKPVPILRQDSKHHSQSLENNYPSASALRHSMESECSVEKILPYVPSNTYSIYEEHWNKDYPITLNDYSLLLKQRILSGQMEQYWGISSDYAQGLSKCYDAKASVNDCIEACKGKHATWTTLSRGLLHGILGLTKEDEQDLKSLDYQLYYQILGFHRESSPLIKAMTTTCDLPLVRHCRPYQGDLSPTQEKLLAKEAYANELYQLIVGENYHGKLSTNQIIV